MPVTVICASHAGSEKAADHVSDLKKGRRSAHRKSRKGCGNCKLRSVKCDESKPSCQKCIKSSFVCNYRCEVPDLQPAFNGTLVIGSETNTSALPKSSSPPLVKEPTYVYPIFADSVSTFQLDSQVLDNFSAFYRNIVLDIGRNRKASHVLQAMSPDLSFMIPIAMHAVQAIITMHSRYSRFGSGSRPTRKEIHHATSAISLLNLKLSSPIQPSERDALWFTSVLLGILAMAGLEATTPEDAWPLKAPDVFDLNWIDVALNKTTIWSLLDPLRSGGKFSSLAEDYKAGYLLDTMSFSGIDGVPTLLAQYCGLDSCSTSDNNPYLTVAHKLKPLIHPISDRPTMLDFLSLLVSISDQFRRLLEVCDPKALLLFSYWHAIGCRMAWWVEKRARLECQAICLYLERSYGNDELLRELLAYPKTCCGLLPIDPQAK